MQTKHQPPRKSINLANRTSTLSWYAYRGQVSTAESAFVADLLKGYAGLRPLDKPDDLLFFISVILHCDGLRGSQIGMAGEERVITYELVAPEKRKESRIHAGYRGI